MNTLKFLRHQKSRRARVTIGLSFVLFSIALLGSALAETFVVTNSNDSGAGSLRQAILNANGSPDSAAINFNIPGAGVHTISPTSPLPVITRVVTIDGYTQPGATPNSELVGFNGTLLIELNGASAGAGGIGLDLNAENSTVRGLVINRFALHGIALHTGLNTIAGNLIGTTTSGKGALGNGGDGILIDGGVSNTIGGLETEDRNVISANGQGIEVTGGANDTVIIGNYIGVNAAGSASLGNLGNGISVVGAASNTRIGGVEAAARNIISGNATAGVLLSGAGVTTNQLFGNYIGTDATGALALGNLGDGIDILNAPDNRIVGSAPNVICGNGGDGILVSGTTASGNVIGGNFIGIVPSNIALKLGNAANGIEFGENASSNSASSNFIVSNGGSGVRVVSGTNDAINFNAIYSNAALGIDLDTAGVTPNDEGDADDGANHRQNFPVLTNAAFANGAGMIDGTLNSTPNTTFRVDFFADQAATSAKGAEGQIPLGGLEATTDASGNTSFHFENNPIFLEGHAFATATATDPFGNTSELSAGLEAVLAPAQALNISTRVDVLTGDNVLIGGFIISGTEAKKVIVRALGPSLVDQGISGALADPILELHQPDGSVTTNDSWKDKQEDEIFATGVAPPFDAEPAIVATLEPGNYTAIVRGVGGGTGIAQVEAYDLDPVAGQLANISTRGFVGTDDNVMIAGFITGSSGGNATIVVRGLGPSLTERGVSGALQDPTIELHDFFGNTLATNNDWKEMQETEIEAVGLAPKNDRESAILSVLPPGTYTVILSGVAAGTGVGLVEAYDLGQE
jgi:hypothetical protein